MLRIEGKKAFVAEINAEVSTALSLVLADYKGLNVAEMTELRRNAQAQQVQLRVVRNTLVKRALDGTDFECLHKALVGPTLMALSHDLNSAARVLDDFGKKNPNLRIKALSVGGEFYGADEVERVVSLPTHSEALTQLVCLLQAPVQKLVSTVNEVPTKLVRTVAAVRDQRQANT